MCITNLILAIHTQSVNGLEEPFYDSRKKFLQPTCSGCIANWEQKKSESIFLYQGLRMWVWFKSRSNQRSDQLTWIFSPPKLWIQCLVVRMSFGCSWHYQGMLSAWLCHPKTFPTQVKCKKSRWKKMGWGMRCKHATAQTPEILTMN